MIYSCIHKFKYQGKFDPIDYYLMKKLGTSISIAYLEILFA